MQKRMMILLAIGGLTVGMYIFSSRAYGEPEQTQPPPPKADFRNGSLTGQADSLPKGWRLHVLPGSQTVGEAKIVPGPTEGTNAIELIWKSGPANVAAEAELAVEPKPLESLMLTGQVKTTGEGRAAYRVEFLDGKGKVLRYGETVPVSSETWRELEMLFTVPHGEAVKKTKIYCLNKGRDSALFASLRLRKAMAGDENEFPLFSTAVPAEGNVPMFGDYPVFHSFIDSPCPLGFQVWGDRKRAQDAALILDLPEELTITEAINAEPHIVAQTEYRCDVVEEDGKKINRYIFPVSKERITNMQRWLWGRVNVVIDPKNPDAAVGKSFLITWRTSAGGKLSPPRRLEMKFLPPLAKTPNPKRFEYMNWKTHDLTFKSPEVRDRMARRFEAAAMDYWPLIGYLDYPLCREMNDYFRARGWKVCKPDSNMMSFKISTFVKDMPEVKYAIDDKGKEKYDDNICPTYFNHDPAFREKLYAFHKDRYTREGLRAGEAVVLDYEPFNLFGWCACEGCRKYFAEMFKLPAVPSMEEIQKKYRDQWREFKFRETEEHLRLVSDVLRKAVPGVKIGNYDYVIYEKPPQVAEYFNRNRVAMDARRIEDSIDFHMLTFYNYNNKGACDLLDYTVKQLKKPAWMISNITRGDMLDAYYTHPDRQLSPTRVGLKMLGAAATGAVGFATFPGWDIDGEFFVSIDRVMAELAALEDFYFDGRRVDELFTLSGEGLEEVVLRAHELNGRVLITLLNFDKAVTADITLKAVDPAKLTGLKQLYSPLTGDMESVSLEQLIGPGLKLQLKPLTEQFLILAPEADERISISPRK